MISSDFRRPEQGRHPSRLNRRRHGGDKDDRAFVVVKLWWIKMRIVSGWSGQESIKKNPTNLEIETANA
jgi:ribosomal protein L15E